MATKVYLITDAKFREEYPVDMKFSTEKFFSSQWIEQKTTLKDFLGDNLWNLVFEIAVKEIPKDYEKKFLEKVQNLMVWYTAQAMEDFDSNNTNDNKVNSIRNKQRHYKKEIKDFVAATKELVVVKDNDTEINRNVYNAFPTYFYR